MVRDRIRARVGVRIKIWFYQIGGLDFQGT